MKNGNSGKETPLFLSNQRKAIESRKKANARSGENRPPSGNHAKSSRLTPKSLTPSSVTPVRRLRSAQRTVLFEFNDNVVLSGNDRNQVNLKSRTEVHVRDSTPTSSQHGVLNRSRSASNLRMKGTFTTGLRRSLSEAELESGENSTPLTTGRCPSNVTPYGPNLQDDNLSGEISRITVGVRVRPLHSREFGNTLVAEGKMIRVASDIMSELGFTFDHVFISTGPNAASQEDVYTAMVKPLLDNAFKGYNACLFAYGQTGSGKTHSMMGSETTVEAITESTGVIPRFCRDLIDRCNSSTMNETGDDCHSSTTLEISYLEVYNEKIRDLLNGTEGGNSSTSGISGSASGLRVREHPIYGPYIVDLSKYSVNSFSDIQHWISVGNKRRAVATTEMNDTSSRSHSLFTITLTHSTIESSENGAWNHERIKRSKINLVDLAGSERIAHSSISSDRLRESVSINKSLLTLGKVITALVEKKSFVPYRESILTRLLKESLGGNSRTAMLATVSPSSNHLEETIATLRYASQARSIVNTVRVNESPQDRIIRELQAEVLKLKGRYNSLDMVTPTKKAKMTKTDSAESLKKQEAEWNAKFMEKDAEYNKKINDLEEENLKKLSFTEKDFKDKLKLVELEHCKKLAELEKGWNNQLASCKKNASERISELENEVKLASASTKSEVIELKKKLSNKEIVEEELKHQLDESKKKLLALAEVSERELKHKVEDSQQREKHLSEKLSLTSEREMKLKKLLKECEEKNEDCYVEVKEATKNMLICMTEKQQLQLKIDELEKQLKESSQAARKWQNEEMADLKNRLESITSERDRWKGQALQYQNEVREHIERSSEERGNLQHQINNWKAKVAKLEEELAAERQSWSEKLIKCENECAATVNSLEDKLGQQTVLQVTTAVQVQANDTCENNDADHARESPAQFSKIKKEVMKLRRKLQDQLKLVEALKSKAEKKSKEVEDLKQNLEHNKTENQKVINDLQRELNMLKCKSPAKAVKLDVTEPQQLVETKKELDAVKSKLADLASEKRAVELANADLKLQIELTKAELEKVTVEFENSKFELEGMASELELLRELEQRYKEKLDMSKEIENKVSALAVNAESSPIVIDENKAKSSGDMTSLLESKIVDLEKKVNQKHNLIAELERANSRYKEEVAVAMQQLMDSNSRCTQLEAAARDNSNSLISQQNECVELEINLKRVTLNLNEAKAELESLKSELNLRNKQVEELKAEMLSRSVKFESDLMNLRSENFIMENKIKQLHNELESRSLVAVANVDKISSEVHLKERELLLIKSDVESRLSEKESEIMKLNDELNLKEKELIKLKTDLEDKLIAANGQNEKLKLDLKDKEIEFAKIQLELKTNENKISEALKVSEDKLLISVQEIKLLKDELASLKKQLTEKDRQFTSEILSKIDGLQNCVAKEKKKTSSGDEKNNSLHQFEMNELKEQVERKKKRIEKLKSRIDALEGLFIETVRSVNEKKTHEVIKVEHAKMYNTMMEHSYLFHWEYLLRKARTYSHKYHIPYDFVSHDGVTGLVKHMSLSAKSHWFRIDFISWFDQIEKEDRWSHEMDKDIQWEVEFGSYYENSHTSTGSKCPVELNEDKVHPPAYTQLAVCCNPDFISLEAWQKSIAERHLSGLQDDCRCLLVYMRNTTNEAVLDALKCIDNIVRQLRIDIESVEKSSCSPSPKKLH